MENTIKKFSNREVQIGLAELGKYGFDDNQILIKNGVKNYKINSVKVSLASNKYVIGLNFTYLDLDTNKIIQGHNQIANSQVKYTQTFILSKDEFIIKLVYRRGMIFDCFGFFTNKNKTYSYGGNGGSYYQFIFKQNYHMGACLLSGDRCLAGIKFDQIPIPGTIKRNEQFIFFQSELYFYFATKYLRCAQTLNLLLLCKKTSQYRFSRQFWLKLLYSYDYYLINYLKRLCKLYQIDQLKSLIQDTKIRDLQFKIQQNINNQQNYDQYDRGYVARNYFNNYNVNNKDNFEISLSQFLQKLEMNSYYILIIGLTIYRHATCEFSLISQEDSFSAIIQPDHLNSKNNRKYNKSIAYMRFAIYFKNTQQIIKTLKKYKIRAQSTREIFPGERFYITEILERYAMIAQILPEEILLGNFKKMSNQIYINYNNTKLTKD